MQYSSNNNNTNFYSVPRTCLALVMAANVSGLGPDDSILNLLRACDFPSHFEDHLLYIGITKISHIQDISEEEFAKELKLSDFQVRIQNYKS